MKNIETVPSVEDVSTQIEAVSHLLSVILEDLLYFGKLDPSSNAVQDQIQIAKLCSNLPKGQALLYLAQEKMNDIQNEVDFFARHSKPCLPKGPEQPVA